MSSALWPMGGMAAQMCVSVSKLINMCATSPCMCPCACLRAWMLHTCADILCVLYMNLYSVPTVPQLNGSLELIGSCELMSSFAVRTSAGSLDGTELETSIWPKGQQVSVLYSVLECSKWHLRFWTLRTKSSQHMFITSNETMSAKPFSTWLQTGPENYVVICNCFVCICFCVRVPLCLCVALDLRECLCIRTLSLNFLTATLQLDEWDAGIVWV